MRNKNLDKAFNYSFFTSLLSQSFLSNHCQNFTTWYFVYSCRRILCSHHMTSFFQTNPSTPSPFISTSSLAGSHQMISSLKTNPSTTSPLSSMSSLIGSHHSVSQGYINFLLALEHTFLCMWLCVLYLKICNKRAYFTYLGQNRGFKH